jgi:hypothetical protein
MTLGNVSELGVQRLIASCLNDACRRVASGLRPCWPSASFREGLFARTTVAC